MEVQANEAEYFGLYGHRQRIESCCRAAPFQPKPDAPKPEIYPVGSHGPACAGGLLEREGRKLLMLRHLK